jgi:hypothetical protein
MLHSSNLSQRIQFWNIRYDSLGGESAHLKDYFCTITTFSVQMTALRDVTPCSVFDDYHLPQNKITRRHILQNNHFHAHSRQKLKHDTVFTNFA